MDAFDDRSPIYLQIADALRRSILSGELTPGAQVMSTTQYATTYRINPATAAKAVNLLVEEGLLEKRRGLGMYVTPEAPARLRRTRAAGFWADVLDPVLVEARGLGITDEQLIRYIRDRHEEDR